VQPLVIASDAGEPRERLVYEQALELARALSHDAEFTLDSAGARLTESGLQRIGRLAGALGGIWAAPQQRESLVALALAALHLRQRGVDYRVENGRVLMAERAGDAAETADTDDTLQRLLEVKEGCRLGVRPDVQARLSLPRFFRRYLHLAGACADARGAEGEFWALYGLKTTLVGAPAGPVLGLPRVFATAAAKRKAVVDRAAAMVLAGNSLLIAARTPAEAAELSGALAAAGIEAGILKGGGGAEEREPLDRLGSAAGVVLVLHPAGRELEQPSAGRTPVKVIAAELHDAHRHLARVCRAFAADSYELLVSLEDAGMAARLGATASWWARRHARADGELPKPQARWLAALAQRGAGRAAAVVRQEILLRDRHLDDLLAFSGSRE
jgi:preprotein translocase subunit SecA